MLIIPVVEGMNWRRPPPVTLALIILNCIVFFFYQSFDEARLERAVTVYLNGPLPELELREYVRHLQSQASGRAAKRVRLPPNFSADDVTALPMRSQQVLLIAMQSDGAFMKRLRAGNLVGPSHARYRDWWQARTSFDRALNEVSTFRFGLNPAAPTSYSWFTSLFLHGSVMHLVGNMVLLFIVGVAVESLVGARWFAGLYLLGGLAGGALYAVTQQGSSIPLVGASGAVSALLGIFTVIYGLRRVNFFYWIIVFIGFRVLPGAVMLPVWIGIELIQHMTRSETSNVGYMAHLGGLLGGALLGAMVLAWKRQTISAKHEARDDEKRDEDDYERGLALMRKLDYAGAAVVFARFVERHPGDAEAAAQLWKIARRDPSSDMFHRAANVLLAVSAQSAAARQTQCELFHEYVATATAAPRLGPQALMQITRVLTQEGYLADAERNLVAMSRERARHPHFPVLCGLLAERLAAMPRVDGALQAKIEKLRAAAAEG